MADDAMAMTDAIRAIRADAPDEDTANRAIQIFNENGGTMSAADCLSLARQGRSASPAVQPRPRPRPVR